MSDIDVKINYTVTFELEGFYEHEEGYYDNLVELDIYSLYGKKVIINFDTLKMIPINHEDGYTTYDYIVSVTYSDVLYIDSNYVTDDIIVEEIIKEINDYFDTNYTIYDYINNIIEIDY